MEKKRLYRSEDEKVFLGVLGGIAKYLDVDPTLVRIIYVVLLFLAPVTAILLYFALALIMPEEPEEAISLDKLPEKAEKLAKEIDETLTQTFGTKKSTPSKEHDNEKLLAVILIILGGVLILRKASPFMWYLQGDILLAVLLLLFGVYLLVRG